MTTTTRYRIAEVAARSGYSPPTLRYYEEIGLLPPAQRSPNGYRTYDQSTLDRLAFISRAKQLGCTLEEISDLAAAWDGGSCAHVQRRLRELVATKVSDAQSRIAGLVALVADLQAARAGLEAHTADGPCDDRCGCTTTTRSVRPDQIPIAVTTTPTTPGSAAAIACRLGATDMDQRIDEWRALLHQVQVRTPIDNGVRLTFQPDTPAEVIARLAAAEQDCCRFFTFTLTIDDRGVALDVVAPADGQDVLAALFGSAA